MSGEFGIMKKGYFPIILKDTFADASTQPFWDAAKEERLVVPKCTNCGTFRLPPSPFCFNCQQRGVEWVELPGTGTVASFTVVRHPLHPDFLECCPYVSGIVELDGTQGAGARMLVNIVDVDVDALRIDDRVKIAWERVNDEMTVFRFVPIDA